MSSAILTDKNYHNKSWSHKPGVLLTNKDIYKPRF